MNTFHILDSHFKFFNTDLWLIDSCGEVRFLHKEYCQSVSLLLINPPVLSVRQSVSVEVTNRYSISLFGNIVLWYYNFLELNALGGQGCILHVKLRWKFFFDGVSTLFRKFKILHCFENVTVSMFGIRDEFWMSGSDEFLFTGVSTLFMKCENFAPFWKCDCLYFWAPTLFFRKV